MKESKQERKNERRNKASEISEKFLAPDEV